MWDWDPRIWDKRNWQGGNLLGEALMEVPKHQWKQVSMFDIPNPACLKQFQNISHGASEGMLYMLLMLYGVTPFLKGLDLFSRQEILQGT